MKKVVIHTDGACHGNPGPGGWAAILEYGPHRRELCGGFAETTNNRMELFAAIAALEALKEPCEVALHSDSSYLVNAVSRRWLERWNRCGWRKADKQPVLNADLWKRLLRQLERHRGQGSRRSCRKRPLRRTRRRGRTQNRSAAGLRFFTGRMTISLIESTIFSILFPIYGNILQKKQNDLMNGGFS